MVAMHVPSSESGSRQKLIHLQILRGLAASLVVCDHTLQVFNWEATPLPQYAYAAGLLGGLGVAAFFALSGFLMVLQTRGMFGVRGAPLLFAYRRLIRIVPIYWIATLLYFHTELSLHFAMSHPWRQLLLSLGFIPNWYSLPLLEPVLGQGWTLNLEMAFYALFTGALLFSRRRGLAGLLAILAGAFLVGRNHPIATTSGPASVLFAYTHPDILLFFAGMCIALLDGALFSRAESKVCPAKTFHSLRFPASPALVLLIPAVVLLTSPQHLAMKMSWGALCAFGAFVVFLCTLDRNTSPGWISRGLMLLGDASYSTYLFHLWVMHPVFDLLLKHGVTPAHPMIFVAACLVAASLLGLAVHWLVERPIALAFRTLRFDGKDGWFQRRMQQPNLGA